MEPTIGLEFTPHSLSEKDQSNAWHILNLTLGEVEQIRRALRSVRRHNAMATALYLALTNAMADCGGNAEDIMETPDENL